MAKIKLNLCLVFTKCFLLCFLVFVVSSDVSNSPDQNSNQNEADGPKLSLLLERLETLEKSHMELKEQFRSSKQKCEDRFKSLEKEVEELKSENCVGEDVWLLTPPLRGRRGQKGEKGDSGIIASKSGKESGQNGQIQLPIPSQNPPEEKGNSTTSAPQSKSKPLTSCTDAMENLPSPRSNKQTIYPHGNNKSLEVLCDFETDGGGWTIIQKRTSGPKQEFNKTWVEYSKGFGSLDKNFWIGLDNIRVLTKNGDQELRIELEDHEGVKKWAEYSNFSVSDASDFYRLSISGYSGDAGNDMIYSSFSLHVHNGMQFSIKDKDNDKSVGTDCAALWGGGWWFNACHAANVNGLYFQKGEAVPYAKGIIWSSWKGFSYSMAKSEMKIRTRK